MGMKFNAKKCHILSIRKKPQFFYSRLDNEILIFHQTSSGTHIIINNIDRKSLFHCRVGFLRSNFRSCPQGCRRRAYLSLIRSTLTSMDLSYATPTNRRDTDTHSNGSSASLPARSVVVGDQGTRLCD